MSWNQNLTNLNYVLAGFYPFKTESLPIARRAGLNVLNISFHDKPVTNWFYILDEAIKQQKVEELIRSALQDYPDDMVLKGALDGRLSAVQGVLLDDADQWHDPAPPDGEAYEKIIGRESTLLDIAYLEIGLQRARSVARVVRQDGATGSGFLIAGNILITNNHVLPTADVARESIIEFNYQRNADGMDLKAEAWKTDPDNGFATSPKEEHDWTAVRLRGDANAKWGALHLRRNETAKNNRVTIIQHPNGLPKQIAFHHNFVRYSDDQVVQYLTDTLPGSSGSPVFDADWDLIALHHSGGNLREPGTKRIVFRNEGIHINKVLEGLQQNGLL